ncbi:hypothetical protein AMAG_12921 [Allomyces macrogynus ATCC 38327]|uniref:Vinculin n=1 Tax=Allomyces macrogynus (strain ATCC 38327) TaxID=578462 RepID=A0A0L0T0G8_ALLM3|nr:hypothetical protein AMAG_12921 [Allomyces macrogynus ATCC 38327]|eukprot:KNE68247.1 hypothetical protein AMAG_12921 [Allomyces macrogynus ATCC 38327]
MLTSTTKALLDPISDAVAQLIVITAQAELGSTPIPDLREYAQQIAVNVDMLSSAGESLLDPEALAIETGGVMDVAKLQAAMTDGCKQVRSAAAQLVAVASQLAADPLSSTGRNHLVDATRGIFAGTQAILNTYDESEIQKIVVVARTLPLRLTQLAAQVATTPTAPDLVTHIKRHAQRSVFLAHLVHARVPELLHPPIAHSLAAHLARLEQAITAAVAATRVILAAAAAGGQNGGVRVVGTRHLLERHSGAFARACAGIARDVQRTAMDAVDEADEEDEAANVAWEPAAAEDARDLRDRVRAAAEAAHDGDRAAWTAAAAHARNQVETLRCALPGGTARYEAALKRVEDLLCSPVPLTDDEQTAVVEAAEEIVRDADADARKVAAAPVLDALVAQLPARIAAAVGASADEWTNRAKQARALVQAIQDEVADRGVPLDTEAPDALTELIDCLAQPEPPGAPEAVQNLAIHTADAIKNATKDNLSTPRAVPSPTDRLVSRIAEAVALAETAWPNAAGARATEELAALMQDMHARRVLLDDATNVALDKIQSVLAGTTLNPADAAGLLGMTLSTVDQVIAAEKANRLAAKAATAASLAPAEIKALVDQVVAEVTDLAAVGAESWATDAPHVAKTLAALRTALAARGVPVDADTIRTLDALHAALQDPTAPSPTARVQLAGSLSATADRIKSAIETHARSQSHLTLATTTATASTTTPATIAALANQTFAHITDLTSHPGTWPTAAPRAAESLASLRAELARRGVHLDPDTDRALDSITALLHLPAAPNAAALGELAAAAAVVADRVKAADVASRGVRAGLALDALATAAVATRTLMENPKDGVAGFRDAARGLVRVVRAERCPDVVADLAAHAHEVGTAAEVVVEGGAGEAAREYLEMAVGEWTKALERAKEKVVVARYEPEVMVASSAAKVERLAHQVHLSKTRGAVTLTSDVASLAAAFRGFVAAVKREADNSSSVEYVTRLARATAAIDDQDPNAVLAAVQDVSNAIRDEKGVHVAALAAPNVPHVPEPEVAGEVVPPAAAPGGAVEEVAEGVGKLAVEVPVVAEDVVVVEEDAPEPLSPKEAQANPLKAAAQELVMETSKWSRAANPVVHTASDISSRLRELAEQYQLDSPAAKLTLLGSTREVVQLCQLLDTHIRQIVDQCTDKRLRTALARSADLIPTLAQQLKILASVKASSPANDLDAERGLVVCAQNLMTAVRDVLRHAEAAALRVNVKTAATVGIAAIKFKRNLFLGKGRRAAAAAAAAEGGASPTTPAPVAAAALPTAIRASSAANAAAAATFADPSASRSRVPSAGATRTTPARTFGPSSTTSTPAEPAILEDAVGAMPVSSVRAAAARFNVEAARAIPAGVTASLPVSRRTSTQPLEGKDAAAARRTPAAPAMMTGTGRIADLLTRKPAQEK